MTRPEIDVRPADESTVEIEADREKLFQLRNAVASAKREGRFPTDEGDRLRSLVPTPNDTLQSATFTVPADDATLLADALREAGNVAIGDDRNATARRIDSDMFAVRKAVGALPDEAADAARNQPDPARSNGPKLDSVGPDADA